MVDSINTELLTKLLDKPLTLGLSGQTPVNMKLANALATSALRPTPVTTPFQSLARLGEAALSGYQRGSITDKQKALADRVMKIARAGGDMSLQDMAAMKTYVEAGDPSAALRLLDERTRSRRDIEETLRKERVIREKEWRVRRQKLEQRKYKEQQEKEKRRYKELQAKNKRRLEAEEREEKRKRQDFLRTEERNHEAKLRKAKDVAEKAKSIIAGEKGLRAEWQKATRSAKLRFESYIAMENAAKTKTWDEKEKVWKTGSSTGDFALIKLLNTILEPSGRVTDQEFTEAAKAGKVTEQAKMWWRRFIESGRLTDTQRREIMATAKAVIAGALLQSDELRSFYRDLAQERGYNHKNILSPIGRPAFEAGSLSTKEKEDRYQHLKAKGAGYDPNDPNFNIEYGLQTYRKRID